MPSEQELPVRVLVELRPSGATPPPSSYDPTGEVAVTAGLRAVPDTRNRIHIP